MERSSDTRTDRPSVLVIDDNPENLGLLSALLKDSYRVKVANSGEKALRHLAGENLPDIVLLDIMMEGMSGYDVIRSLKSEERSRDIPVIFLTGMSSAEDERKGLDMGAADYITKPISPPIVLARIRTQLENKAAADFLRDQNAYLEAEVARRTAEASAMHQVAIRTLAERESLLRELYHRTRNNMQTVMSILSLEADASGDTMVNRIVADTIERINSMSLVQAVLYESRDLSRVDLRLYFEELIKLVCDGTVFDKDRFVLDAGDKAVYALCDVAVPCGLVTRELLSNAVRHAYPSDSDGQVRVGLRYRDNGNIEVSVEDEGRGLPAGFSIEGATTLGFQLIRGIVIEQLSGSVSFGGDHGFVCRFDFPDSRYARRI